MPVVSFDFETYLIADGLQIPPAVCMSYEVRADDGLARIDAGVVRYDQGIAWLREWLARGCRMVGANTGFDVLVSILSAPDPEAMRALWVGAYEEDRVTDVLLRQGLIDLSRGYMRPEGYGLAKVSERHTGVKVDKSADTWRLRFGQLDGLLPSQYPREAYDYALYDAIATGAAYAGQERQRAEGSPFFPGRDILHNESARARKALAIKELEVWGLRADPRTTALFETQTRDAMETRREVLVAGGLIERSVTRSKNGVIAYAEAHGLAGHYRAASGKLSFTKQKHLSSGDRSLQDLANWPECDIEGLALAGLVNVKFTQKQAKARARMLRVGWDATALAALDALTTRLDYIRATVETDKKGKAILKEVETFRKAAVTQQWRGGKVTDTGNVSLDGDACHFSDDHLLRTWSEYSALAKTMSNDIKWLTKATFRPAHATYETLKETGRTSARDPAVQTMPRAPGVRECVVPAQGHVFIEADYSAVELHSFAQVCYDALGFSKVGDALNAGVDLHLQMGAAYLGIEYADAFRRKQEGDDEIDKARTMGKGVNFGAKGAMGPDRFVDYCWNNYGLPITRELAVELLALHASICEEWGSYSRWIKSHARSSHFGAKIDIAQPYSGRLRAGLGYCDAHNSPFQGLAADLGGEALWTVLRATWGLSELGRQDPLYGAHMVLWVHDSLTLEVREANAHAAALRLQEIMEAAGRKVLPRCPPRAEPLIARQLSKLNKPVTRNDQPLDKGGVLVPFCVWDAARAKAEAARKAGKDPADAIKKWPEYIRAEVLRAA